jgi:CRP-like cAMP-binding protein
MNKQDEQLIKKLLNVKDKIKFFKDLEDDEIRILMHKVVFKKYEKNEIIFAQGDNSDNYIYYILQGFVNIHIRGEDNIARKVATLHPGTVIGEMKPILDEGRTATCVAGTPGAIVIGFIIDQTDPSKDCLAYAKFYRNMAYILAKKVQDTNKRIK